MLPGEIAKTKWNKKAKEVLSWEDWWEMHEKVSPSTCYYNEALIIGLAPPPPLLMDQSIHFLSKDTEWWVLVLSSTKMSAWRPFF